MSGLARFVVLTDGRFKGNRPSFILWVGQSYPRYLLVWGTLDDAIEEVGEWCEEHAPGLLYPAENIQAAYQEALAEGHPDERAWQIAEQDLTCLDGFRHIQSEEWGIVAENPDRGTILELKKQLESQYY